jgi:tetratricopeptide (TPR) repeat protein
VEARLDEASARLGACGADPELIRLAMRCLSPDGADRPADGGEVASAMAEYRSSVQERLHQERLARERQEVRAAEGRRRQRAWAAATLGVLLALALGVVASTIFALGERAAHRRATQQALMAEESLFLLEDVLAQADPQSEANRHITLRQALDRTTDRLKGGRLKDGVKTPESNARMRIALGKIYFNLGEYPQSRDLFAEAHRIARDELGETHPTAMTALDQLGKAHMFLEEFADAERVLTRAYELQREVLGPDHEDTVHTHAKLADLYGDMGKLDRAREIGESVLSQRRRLWGDEYEFTLVSMNNLGVVYRDLDRPADALPLFEEAERIAMGTWGEDHPATLAYKYNRGMALAELGRREEALRLLSECLAGRRRILGENHFLTLKTEYGIATALFKMGRHAESTRISESILGRLGTSIGADHSFRGNVLVNLGQCLTATGKYPEAERALLEAQAIFSKKLYPDHRSSRAAAEALVDLLERKARPPAEEGHPCETPISSS